MRWNYLGVLIGGLAYLVMGAFFTREGVRGLMLRRAPPPELPTPEPEPAPTPAPAPTLPA
jgi:hypothetical protein